MPKKVVTPRLARAQTGSGRVVRDSLERFNLDGAFADRVAWPNISCS
jgi:hypothetical protein